MWPRKKYWWETGPGGTPPLQNPTNTLPTDVDDPMWRISRDIQHPDVRILPKAQSNPIKIYPNTGPPGLVPRRMPTAPYQGMEPTATLDVADSAWDTTHTPMAGKKGLSVKNMINAMSKLKSPTGEDFSRVSGRAGGSRPIAPSPRALGVDALEMASADDPRKKWWKQWQGLMGA